MFPGEGAAGSQLRRRGESTGPEQGSSYVISNPANSWDLQKVTQLFHDELCLCQPLESL